MSDTPFRVLAEAALTSEPALRLDAAEVIKEGRRVLRRRAVVAGSALSAVLVVAAAGVSGLAHDRSASGRDQLGTTAAAGPAHVSRTPQPNGPVEAEFEALLRQQVQAGFSVTQTFVAEVTPDSLDVLPGVPHRVSLSLGSRGWVSLLTGARSPFQGDPCAAWTGACTVTRDQTGALIVTRGAATPAGRASRSSAVTIVLPTGHWVSATASDVTLNPDGTPGSVAADEPPVPLGLSQLRDIAQRAADLLR